MMITTKRSIAVFKPVLLAGVLSVGLLPAVGNATSSIAAARDNACGTTNFFTSDCSQCHSGTPSASTAFTSNPACPEPVAVAPPPDPVVPPPDPVAPPPDPVAPPPDPVAPPPDLVAPTDPVLDDCTDRDDDGFAKEGGSCGPIDCRDRDSDINPDAEEICDDGIDNNCNGLVDLADNKACGIPVSCTDGDNDGFYTGGRECGPADCDDGNWLVNPGENEVCTDGIDNNCNARIDGEDIACRVRDNDEDEEDDHDRDHDEDGDRDRD